MSYNLKELHELSEEDRQAIHEYAMRRSAEIVDAALVADLPEWELRLKRIQEDE